MRYVDLRFTYLHRESNTYDDNGESDAILKSPQAGATLADCVINLSFITARAPRCTVTLTDRWRRCVTLVVTLFLNTFSWQFRLFYQNVTIRSLLLNRSTNVK